MLKNLFVYTILIILFLNWNSIFMYIIGCFFFFASNNKYFFVIRKGYEQRIKVTNFFLLLLINKILLFLNQRNKIEKFCTIFVSELWVSVCAFNNILNSNIFTSSLYRLMFRQQEIIAKNQVNWNTVTEIKKCWFLLYTPHCLISVTVEFYFNKKKPSIGEEEHQKLLFLFNIHSQTMFCFFSTLLFCVLNM